MRGEKIDDVNEISGQRCLVAKDGNGSSSQRGKAVGGNDIETSLGGQVNPEAGNRRLRDDA